MDNSELKRPSIPEELAESLASASGAQAQQTQVQIDDGPDIVSLGMLLSKGRSPAILATAIEKFGVHGWDRFGRFGLFGKNSPDERAALDALAAEFAAFSNDQPLPSEQDEFDSPFSLCGWPADQLPKLDKIKVRQRKLPRTQAGAREENATLRLVGALLEFIEGGKAGRPAHPLYKDDPQLATELVKIVGDYPGLGLSTIKRKFDRSRASLQE